ncbi:nitroreductase [Nocardia transvalensis]|uniref:Nitroreductase n=1 Tax=Nocardia transvalensis TaxID=37333 RepID=A0A7W9PIG4_9NOCA|nr:NAD(P)H nitroreductase [Nocardia transvalensis]MBB5916700.1 nitroreductase [Nocardia transvalensis]
MTNAPASDVIEKAVLLAGRAPSLHNSQPWRWVFDGTELHLHTVRERMLTVTDASGRQMILGCGIALGHLRAAMAAAGWRTIVDRFPNPNDHEHLATVRFARARVVTDGDRDRADAIVRRHTDRAPFAAPPGWDTFETILRTTFDPADATLDTISDDYRPALAHASELTAALRRYDSGYHAELQWWTGHVVGRAGVPREALVPSERRNRVPVARRLPSGTAAPSPDEPETDRSTILLLSTDDDSAGCLLSCGEVLSAVLLECTLAGYATCPLTHLTEVPRARAVVAGIVGRKTLPQVLIRVGAARASDDRTEPTPRLPLAEILEVPEGIQP